MEGHMFKVNTSSNTIQALESKRFSELGFSERKHLQEWLENCPEALGRGEGDELLIIQKEFDGFDETKERLDLLALDKEGNLVIIENKLDDSGKDVVWQSLKYASYCANLSKQQIVEIFQRYLNQKAAVSGKGPLSAEKVIIEFLDADDFESIQLNRIRSQRIMMVAARYRREVTNTVLWLSQFGLACQCFKVTPYKSGDDIFISVEQIIPTPESKEFMIGMVAKESEERHTDMEEKTRHSRRMEFWGRALEAFGKSGCNLFNNISPTKDHWISAGSGISSMPYNLIFSKNEIRVEFSMQRSEAEQNTLAYQALLSMKDQIEMAFGAALDWLPLPEKKSCRIQYAKAVDSYDKDNWDAIIAWMVEHMTRLEAAIKPHMNLIYSAIKPQH